MSGPVDADLLLTAAKSVTTTFEDLPGDPVHVRTASVVDARETAGAVERYERHGFAIVQVDDEPVTPHALLRLTRSFDLGEPFVPDLYRRGGKTPAPVSRISAAANVGTADADHPSFGRTVGQELHCDGTLQPLGHIKASLLLCEFPAARGGHTTLFNASAAFARLAADDTAAARALAVPGVLVRQANINGATDVNAQPAFAVQDGRLVAGYSVTATDRWAVPDEVVEEDLLRGVRFLRDAARPGSPYFTQLTLDAGQGIVFDNTRISHGRTPYEDSPGRQRCLYRSLHLRHPRVRSGVPAR
ncbi:TauD/TfdA family dioxygenase [Streptomyces sp. NPDC003247]|uniref:TauD/TfdA family dioxygenase n=1 Tax=Streptomyces sp. NPDC003247 TaxID=3364677 RepID=UPI00369D5107